MKYIILAAGEGKRLWPYTKDRPKCMVKVGEVSIIDRQILVMKRCGITEKDICIVTGYQSEILKEHFGNSEITLIHNERYNETNMVYSLMCARKYFENEDSFIISYGDIIYNETVLKKIIYSKYNISVIVDDEWKEYWLKRFANPLDDAETLQFDKNNKILKIGQKAQNYNEIMAQYIGLLKFADEGIEKLLLFADIIRNEKDILSKANCTYDLLYFTDLLQGMIDFGYEVKAVHINRGWYEIDNIEDLFIADSELD